MRKKLQFNCIRTIILTDEVNYYNKLNENFNSLGVPFTYSVSSLKEAKEQIDILRNQGTPPHLFCMILGPQDSEFTLDEVEEYINPDPREKAIPCLFFKMKRDQMINRDIPKEDSFELSSPSLADELKEKFKKTFKEIPDFLRPITKDNIFHIPIPKVPDEVYKNALTNCIDFFDRYNFSIIILDFQDFQGPWRDKDIKFFFKTCQDIPKSNIPFCSINLAPKLLGKIKSQGIDRPFNIRKNYTDAMIFHKINLKKSKSRFASFNVKILNPFIVAAAKVIKKVDQTPISVSRPELFDNPNYGDKNTIGIINFSSDVFSGKLIFIFNEELLGTFEDFVKEQNRSLDFFLDQVINKISHLAKDELKNSIKDFYFTKKEIMPEHLNLNKLIGENTVLKIVVSSEKNDFEILIN